MIQKIIIAITETNETILIIINSHEQFSNGNSIKINACILISRRDNKISKLFIKVY